ncbi:MAG: hypothetical protein Kow00122_17610 [Thermoleophilia bacterium]
MLTRFGLVVVAALVIVLAVSAVALAATPQDIYNDYAADGDLDGTYTAAELEAYLNDATLHQYGLPSVLQPLDNLATAVLGEMNEGKSFEEALAAVTGEKPPVDEDEDRSAMPFTGFELLVALAGGAALIGGGIAIRKNAR